MKSKIKNSLGFIFTSNFGANLQSKRGFTLIELLVVIAIIGLLASVVLVSLNSTRKKARDTKRVADIDQIYKALNLYYDQYGCLPLTTGSTCGTASGGAYNQADGGGWDYSSQGTGFMQFLQTAGFMPKVPVDPLNNMTGDNTPTGTYAYKYYCYTGSPAGLHLSYILEADNTWQIKNATNSGNWADSSFNCQ